MSNELLLFLSAAVSIICVFTAARLGSKWLFGAIAVNLILVTIFGAKLIPLFGFATNAGNVFYANVFLATHFLLERRNKESAYQTIAFGAGLVAFFIVMSQFVVHLSGLASGEAVNSVINSVFILSPRIAVASILAYIFAQYLNIRLYLWLKERLAGRFLWLRSNCANILAQLLDSLIFFTIAFLDLPGILLVKAILVSWLVKVAVVLLGTPFLYLDKYFKQDK